MDRSRADQALSVQRGVFTGIASTFTLANDRLLAPVGAVRWWLPEKEGGCHARRSIRINLEAHKAYSPLCLRPLPLLTTVSRSLKCLNFLLSSKLPPVTPLQPLVPDGTFGGTPRHSASRSRQVLRQLQQQRQRNPDAKDLNAANGRSGRRRTKDL
jgi:hypothetical protein